MRRPAPLPSSIRSRCRLWCLGRTVTLPLPPNTSRSSRRFQLADRLRREPVPRLAEVVRYRRVDLSLPSAGEPMEKRRQKQMKMRVALRYDQRSVLINPIKRQ